MLKDVSYFTLVLLAVVMAVIPLGKPHLHEKLQMLFAGELKRPLDIFDLFFHASPLFAMLLKWVTNR
jgi:hypothetical protein